MDSCKINSDSDGDLAYISRHGDTRLEIMNDMCQNTEINEASAD